MSCLRYVLPRRSKPVVTSFCRDQLSAVTFRFHTNKHSLLLKVSYRQTNSAEGHFSAVAQKRKDLALREKLSLVRGLDDETHDLALMSCSLRFQRINLSVGF